MTLAEELSKKYGRTVMPVSCVELTEETITEILKNVLFEFPLKGDRVFDAQMGHDAGSRTLVAGGCIYSGTGVCGGRQRDEGHRILAADRGVSICQDQQDEVHRPGHGLRHYGAGAAGRYLLQSVGRTTGLEICDEASLMPCIINLARIKTQYEKIKSALDEVNATGYGIVMPGIDELTLEEPEIVHQGGRYGVRLRASAPSINMIRTEISTEVAPIVGSERQSEELVKSLLADFEEDPGKIWQSNIFGKSLHELVNEGLQNKLLHMPSEARTRLQETIERVINEGCSGLICIISIIFSTGPRRIWRGPFRRLRRAFYANIDY